MTSLVCGSFKMLFQRCSGWWYVFHIVLLCKNLSSSFVNVMACASPVIHQDHKSFDGMDNIFLYDTWRTGQFQQHICQFRQCSPCCLFTVPNKARNSITAREGMKHWKSLSLLGSKSNCHTMSCQVAEMFASSKCNPEFIFWT